MRILKIVLDGFKSYAQPTALEACDAHFTVITGRNGAGKSNVLDALLFVLGLHSWRLARAHSALELIYKAGQAGVRVARVTVVFCNRDKARSPADLIDVDELVVVREVRPEKTQYSLNGRLETVDRMRKLFKSVGLNVDNPTSFFVQQGRVAAIVAGQPLELMDCLEEAAGTAFYNAVKADCLGTIERKQEKLDGVGQMLGAARALMEEKLAERKTLRAWREAGELVAQLTSRRRGILVRAAQLERQSLAQRDGDNAALHQLQRLLRDVTEQLAARRAELAQLGGTGEEEMRAAEERERNDRLELEERQRALGVARSLALSLEGQLTEATRAETEARAAQRLAAARLEELDRARVETAAAVERRRVERGRLVAAGDQQAALKVARFYREGECAAAKEQLKAIEKEESVWRTKVEEAKAQATRRESEATARQLRVAELTRQIEQQKAVRTELEVAVSQLEEALRKAAPRDGERPRGDVEGFELHWSPSAESLRRELATQIRGRLCALVRPREQRFVLALERAAGGRLWNIVVESDGVAERLLAQNALQRKETFIPLNKVMGGGLTPAKLARAAEIAAKNDGTIWNPLELIECESAVQRAAEFAWGDRLIASSQAVARAVAFADGLGLTVVTLDGDSVSPAGVFEGGFVAQRRSLFALAAEARRAEEQLAIAQRVRETADGQRRELADRKAALAAVRESLERIEAELRRIARIEESAEDNVAEAEERLSALLRRKAELQTRLTASESGKDADPVRECEAALTAAEEQLKTQTADARAAKLIDEQLIDQCNYQSAKRAKLCDEQKVLADRIRIAEEATAAAQTRLVLGQNEIEERRRALQQRRGLETAVAQLEEESAQHQKQLEECRRLAERRAARLEELRQLEASDCPAELADLPSDRVEALLAETEAELHRAERRAATLAKHVDKEAELEVQRMADGFQISEERYQTVLRDRTTLTHNIAALDEQRERTIERSFEAVAEHFGSIADFLLPHVGARLELVDVRGRRGIAIRAMNGGVEIRDLKSLSGGQRSLLALAYILALLRHKPGPFYILDEVDAALDLAHSERLGEILAREFPQSQFLVISLREEFLASANVIFQVSAKDGKSQVCRIPPFGTRLDPRAVLAIEPEEARTPLSAKGSKSKDKRPKQSKRLKGSEKY